MMPKLADKNYLFENQLTHEQALQDYFKLLVSEIFISEVSEEVMKADLSEKINHFTVKFNRIF